MKATSVSQGMGKLRILFVCLGDFHAPPGPRQMYAFARALVDAGHSVRLLVQGNPATVVELGENVDPRVEVGAYRFGLRRLSEGTLQEGAAFQPDVIHLYEPRHAPALAALALTHHTGGRLFVRVADDDRFIEEAAGQPTLYWRLAKACLKRAAIVVPNVWPFSHPQSFERLIIEAHGFDAISPALARETANRIGRPCRPILPAASPPREGSVTDSARAEHKLPRDARLLLYAGSVYRPHFPDYELLLRAFGILASRRSDVHLVHTGRVARRYRPELLREIAGPGANRLHLLGFLPTEQDVARLMTSCDVLVQPGTPTEFNRLRLPAKLHDYLVSGRPVVCYETGLDELLTDGEHALLTKSGHPEELAEVIGRLLDDEQLAHTIGKGGRTRALELFSPARAVKEILSYYREQP
jgi:glycosyltransferase involved in cell wall biosynthesis